MITTIDWVGGKIRIIDQTRLPLELRYLELATVKALWQAIKSLQVRGAPAIGIAVALGVALGASKVKTSDPRRFREEVVRAIRYLAASRPTAVNLFWALRRMEDKLDQVCGAKVKEAKEALLGEALAMLREDKEICRRMAGFASTLIKDGDTCLTICNAGALATVDYGTALGAFYRAKEEGRKFRVFACETRPLLQGARLSAWELKRHGIDVTLIADNTAAFLMSQKKIDKVFIGADRIAANGDTANKIGTYNLALVSAFHGVRFYVVAPASTFDLSLKTGKDIPIEHRRESEILKLQSIKVAPDGVRAYNPAFDITRHSLISAFVSERGIIHVPFAHNISRVIKNRGGRLKCHCGEPRHLK